MRYGAPHAAARSGYAGGYVTRAKANPSPGKASHSPKIQALKTVLN